MEFPIAENGNFLVSEEYVRYIVNYGNKKLEDNFRRIGVFFEAVEILFTSVVDQTKDSRFPARTPRKGAFS